MKRFLVGFAFWLVCAGAASATETTGTVTVSVIRVPALSVFSISATSNAAGDIYYPLDFGAGVSCHGLLQRVTVNPADGATSPTDAFDLTLLDLDGVDVLAGLGADLSRSASTSFRPTVGDGVTSGAIALQGALTLTGDNMGASKGAVVRLYVKP